MNMNWLIVILNITFASTAALLCVLGWKTLKSIRHLNMGKAFWIPVFVSGLFFSIGCIITIFNEVGFSLAISNEIVQFAQLIALCFISGGIYAYSKNIRKNLPEKLIIPEATFAENDKVKVGIMPTPPFDNRIMTSNNLRVETASGCNHQLGYLRTVPINTSLPEECLGCAKIIECKH
jgi:hypothetical protein